jgi:hypothetical protein
MLLKIETRHKSHYGLGTPRKELLSASLFTFGVLLFVAIMLYLGVTSISDGVILGSELNGDGTVEYLCLGTQCENLNRMDW